MQRLSRNPRPRISRLVEPEDARVGYMPARAFDAHGSVYSELTD